MRNMYFLKQGEKRKQSLFSLKVKTRREEDTVLKTWKAIYLSMSGRPILVNSVLTVIPTYYLSVLYLPVKVEHEMDKIQRRFL